MQHSTFLNQLPRNGNRPTAIITQILKKCRCHALTNAQLIGNETNFTCTEAIELYRAHNAWQMPNAPNSWRTNVVRNTLKNSASNIHLVPMYCQLTGRRGGSSRRDGDCTHKDLYSTVMMLFQWTRAIIDLDDK